MSVPWPGQRPSSANTRSGGGSPRNRQQPQLHAFGTKRGKHPEVDGHTMVGGLAWLIHPRRETRHESPLFDRSTLQIVSVEGNGGRVERIDIYQRLPGDRCSTLIIRIVGWEEVSAAIRFLCKRVVKTHRANLRTMLHQLRHRMQRHAKTSEAKDARTALKLALWRPATRFTTLPSIQIEDPRAGMVIDLTRHTAEPLRPSK